MLEQLLNTAPATQRTLLPFNRLKVTNVKGVIDLQLHACMFLQGSNKAHKTGHLDAIRLALTGKHPIGGYPSDLYELAPAGAQFMEALLIGPSGAAHWRLEAPSGKPTRPEPPKFTGDLDAIGEGERANILALAGIGELLRYGKDRMREALMQRFGAATEVPTPMGINSAQAQLWQEARGATGNGAGHADPSEQLAAMAKWFRSKSRKDNAEANTIEKTIARRKEELETQSAGSELLADYQAKMQRAAAWENAAASRVRKAELEQQIEDLREEARALLEELGPDPEPALPTDAEQAMVSARETQMTAQAAVDLLDGLLGVAQGGQQCSMCGTHGVDMNARIQQLAEARGRRQAEVERAEADIQRWRAIVDRGYEAHDEWRERQQMCESSKSTIKTKAARLHAELEGVNAGLVDVPNSYEGPSAAEFKREIERIKELEVTRKKLFKDSEDMHRLRGQAETCKVLERESAKILKDLLKNVQSTAEATVNKYMPVGFRATLVITDKAVEWRVLGDDDRAHKRGAMSGSEFGALLVAVACAWTEGSPLRVVLLDDGDIFPFDDEGNFEALLVALKSAVDRGDLTQVIIAGWRKDIPADWHIVRLGA